jgi:hypothetical protein
MRSRTTWLTQTALSMSADAHILDALAGVWLIRRVMTTR